MIKSNDVKLSLCAGGVAFVLCLVAMLAGGTTWGTGAAGWLVFLALVFSAGAGLVAWHMIRAAGKERWLADRNDTIDRLNDAQRCIKAEEIAHSSTKRELVDVRQQLSTANALASDAKREYGNMRDRAAERGRTIDELQGQISKIKRDLSESNDNWRKQLSNMRESAYSLAVHIEGSANGLPEEWQDWGAELAQDLRKLAGACGVVADARQVTIDEAIAEPASIEELQAEVVDSIERVKLVRSPLPDAQTQPTPIHIAHSLMAKVRENQAQRRANLDMICHAVELGYELSDEFTAAYHRGMIWVTDELIAKERGYIEHSQPSE